MDKFSLFVYCNFLVLLSTTVCSQNINNQNVNIADETLTDYSFLTKSKKRPYRIRHWIPMFLGHPVSSFVGNRVSIITCEHLQIKKLFRLFLIWRRHFVFALFWWLRLYFQRNVNNGAPMVVPGRKGSEPTFWEFVTAIIEVMIYYGGRGLYQYNEDGFLFKF